MEARAGLTPASFQPAHRVAVRERLHADMRRRGALGRRGRSALDGIVHALKPHAMDASFPERRLLDYCLDGDDGPTAVVAVGDPARATHVTWLVSGMGIRAHTAMWGTAQEAARLWAAQREVGAPRPCTIAWLGYAAPPFWKVPLDAPGRAGGEALARDIEAWSDFARSTGPQARGTAPYVSIESHSYGTLVAAHALRRLRERTRQTGQRHVDALVLAGAIGLPADLFADGDDVVDLSRERVFQAAAPGDLLARLGRLVSSRAPWTDTVRLPTAPVRSLGGAAVSGHDTSRWRREKGADAPRGYRDPGTVTLAATARVTAGLPLPEGAARH